eukprot:403363386
MATDQSRQKRQQADNERKRSYIEVGRSALNQSNGGQSSMMRNNPSGQDVGMSQGSIPSRGHLGAGQNNLPAHTTSQNANSLYAQSKQNQLFDKKNDPNFPTALEIEQFQSQRKYRINVKMNFIVNSERIKSLSTRFKNERSTLNTTIRFQDFKKILEEEFRTSKPADNLTQYMFERFRKFKFSENGQELDKKQDMDILDFLLALNLLARIVYDKKLRLMFELCDDDDDGCMRPAEILQMLQRVERIFARECSRVLIESSILIYQIADQKAEQNFHFIMGMIKHQNIKKQQEQAKREQSQKDIKNSQGDTKQQSTVTGQGSTGIQNGVNQAGAANQEGLKAIAYDVDEDNLITYREFMSAIKGLKNSLYKSILPRTLSFVDVLSIVKKEEDYKISDIQVDDFAMFRYELNSIFRKHHFQDESNSEMFGGKHPLSKVGGLQLKDLPNDTKKEYMEMYRPPGIIRSQETNIQAKPAIDDKITYAVPNSKLFRRGKDNERKDNNFNNNDRAGYLQMQQQQQQLANMMGGTIGSLAGGNNNQNNNNLLNPNMDNMRGGNGVVNNLFKKLEDVLYIHTKAENPNGLNFQELYQENLPPEARELDDYVKKFKDKDTSKDKEIQKYQNNAREKLRRVQNLVPENKIQISALRLEENEELGGDRRNKMLKAMNAPQISQQKIKDELLIEQIKEIYS